MAPDRNMTENPDARAVTRVRFETRRRALRVAETSYLSPNMRRVELRGDLEGFHSLSFDDHIKLFLPDPKTGELVLPDPGAGHGDVKALMRDYTPRRFDVAKGELTIDFALHNEGEGEAGPATAWARSVRPGDTLSKIAEAHLGDGARYPEIAKLNHDVTQPDGMRLTDPNLIRPGWVLRLPDEATTVTRFAPRPDVVAERKLLADVDVFALFYPFWLNAPPAMLKGYLDRVFGFGFAYGKDGRSTPLLKGRMLITFSSSGAPDYWVKETGAMETIGKLFDRYFADLCGMHFLEHVHFGNIVPGATPEFVTARLAETRRIVEKHFRVLA